MHGLSIRCSRNVGTKPPRNVIKAEHLCLCSVESWACRQRNGSCESGGYWFLTDVFSLYSGVFLLAGSCGCWSHDPGQQMVPGHQHGWKMAEGKGGEGFC